MSLFFVLFSFCLVTLAERGGFPVRYDTANQRAIWTARHPKPSTAPASRKYLRKDRQLNSLPSAAFTNSGFDRGHLTPSAGVPESEDTVLTSNAIAHNPRLNRGERRSLENQIRNRHATHVITGAIYNDCGIEKIQVPSYVFKIE